MQGIPRRPKLRMTPSALKSLPSTPAPGLWLRLAVPITPYPLPLAQPAGISKRAYDPALSGWGEKRVLVVVVDDAGTAGPAGSDAGGAVATPQPPPHGSDGPRRRLSIWCAGFGPGIPCLSAWGAVKRAAWPSERRWS